MEDYATCYHEGVYAVLANRDFVSRDLLNFVILVGISRIPCVGYSKKMTIPVRGNTRVKWFPSNYYTTD